MTRNLPENQDFLDEMIAARGAKNPRFPALVDGALERRRLARGLARRRQALGASQTAVAARMRTSASVVSKLEGGADVRLSTLQKYAAAMGLGLEVRLKAARATSRKG